MAGIIKQTSEPAQPSVLKLTDLVAEARQVVLDARKQAAKILADARAQAQRLTAEVSRQAYDEGYQRGRLEGQESAVRASAGGSQSDSLDAERRVLLEAARELASGRQAILDEARQELLELALALASKVVGQVAVRDPQAARANLAKAMELLSTSAQAVIKVNPRQLDSLRHRCRELADELNLRAQLTLVGDEAIEPGGVKIVHGGGEIDATIATQLDKLAQAIAGNDEPLLPGIEGEYESDAATLAKRAMGSY